ncbi:MAG: DUF4382 domain-containing protein [Sphingobacteriales bacterium]|nr:DUF4382 domain-containing protein [Sphingobacteriales bacterium]
MKNLPGRFAPLLTVFAGALLFLYSCQKEANLDAIPEGKARLSVYLTDGPLDFQHVWIDIQSIAVKVDTCRRNHDADVDGPGCDDDHDSLSSHCEYWDTLSINPGVYDLLALRNGVDTLLASGFIINGKIERIKFTLGTNNSIMVDSVTQPLHLVNNQDFVFVNVGHEHLDSLSAGNFQLYLDFDLARSIRYTGGQYWLKPYLKPFGRHSTGEIEGKVRPVHFHGLIKAYNDTDTAFASPWSEGEFKIRGLRPGTYNVFIDGINGYQDTLITNIDVQRGRDTQLGLIQLHQ